MKSILIFFLWFLILSVTSCKYSTNVSHENQPIEKQVQDNVYSSESQEKDKIYQERELEKIQKLKEQAVRDSLWRIQKEERQLREYEREQEIARLRKTNPITTTIDGHRLGKRSFKQWTKQLESKGAKMEVFGVGEKFSRCISYLPFMVRSGYSNRYYLTVDGITGNGFEIYARNDTIYKVVIVKDFRNPLDCNTIKRIFTNEVNQQANDFRAILNEKYHMWRDGYGKPDYSDGKTSINITISDGYYVEVSYAIVGFENMGIR